MATPNGTHTNDNEITSGVQKHLGHSEGTNTKNPLTMNGGVEGDGQRKASDSANQM